MTLQFVQPDPDNGTRNILIYGPSGVGKTVAATSAPGPVLVVNAEGPSALAYARASHGNDHIREVQFTGAQTLLDTYDYLRAGGDTRTVVVDTVGEVHSSLLAEYGGDRPTLQQHGDVNLRIERFVRALRDLPVNVVLVCHEQIDDQDGETVRRPMTGGKKLPEKLMAMMDIAAYAGVIPETDNTPRRYVGQLVEMAGRRAKDRSGVLGLVRDMDLTEWVQTYNRAMVPATAKEGA